MTKLFRVLEYEKVDVELFRGYIREFMTEKLHTSGFDSTIKGNSDAETDFVKVSREKFGFKIEPEKMKKNPGRRQLSKLALNNLCKLIKIKFWWKYFFI